MVTGTVVEMVWLIAGAVLASMVLPVAPTDRGGGDEGEGCGGVVAVLAVVMAMSVVVEMVIVWWS